MKSNHGTAKRHSMRASKSLLNCVRAATEFDSMFRMSVGTSPGRSGLSEGGNITMDELKGSDEKDVGEDGCRMVIG